jgi:hypothetical protein
MLLIVVALGSAQEEQVMGIQSIVTQKILREAIITFLFFSMVVALTAFSAKIQATKI